MSKSMATLLYGSIERFGLLTLLTGSSCAQVLDIDKDYHLPGSGGADGGTTGSTTTSSGETSTTTTETGGTGGGSSTTTTGGTGGTGGVPCANGVKPCGQPADCDATGNECTVPVCEDGCCGTENVGADTPVMLQTSGDCQQVVCDGTGAIKSSANNDDVPADDDECHTGSCSRGSPTQKAKLDGATCSLGVCCNEDCIPSVAEVAMGQGHTCARKTDGTLWCWGQNIFGELGDGMVNGPKLLPVQVGALGADVVQVAAGTQCTCARKTDTTLWCWGNNNSGQLGDGTTGSSDGPVQVVALGAAVADVILGGVSHVCARKTDSTLWCWGNNNNGQLGNGTTSGSLSPVEVVALGTSVMEAAAGDLHTCARKTDGSVWCWGDNSNGQLGDGSTSGPDCAGTCSAAPAQVSALGNSVVEITAGGSHTCARQMDGTLWCWGTNVAGELGDGTIGGPACNGTCKPSPVKVNGLINNVTQAAAGVQHTCAREIDGTLWCWGYDEKGQMGDGMAGGSHPSPVQVNTLGTAVVELAAAYHRTCARKTDGTLWCWGDNAYGALGDGTTSGPACQNTCQPSPTQAMIGVCQ